MIRRYVSPLRNNAANPEPGASVSLIPTMVDGIPTWWVEKITNGVAILMADTTDEQDAAMRALLR